MQTLGEAREAAGKIGDLDAKNKALTEIAEIASACASSGNREDAEATFDMAFHTALRLHDLMPEIRALGSLATKEAEASYVTGAKATIAAVRKASVPIKERNDAAEASDEMAHRMTDIAVAQWRSSDEAGAKTTFNDSRKMTEGFPEANDKVSNLMYMACAIARAYQPEQR